MQDRLEYSPDKALTTISKSPSMITQWNPNSTMKIVALLAAKASKTSTLMPCESFQLRKPSLHPFHSEPQFWFQLHLSMYMSGVGGFHLEQIGIGGWDLLDGFTWNLINKFYAASKIFSKGRLGSLSWHLFLLYQWTMPPLWIIPRFFVAIRPHWPGLRKKRVV